MALGPWASPRDPHGILHRPALLWELLMTGWSLGRGNRRTPPQAQVKTLALTRHVNSQRKKTQSWDSRSLPQTEIETPFRDKWGNGPKMGGVRVESHWGGPCRHSFLRILTGLCCNGDLTQSLLTTLPPTPPQGRTNWHPRSHTERDVLTSLNLCLPDCKMEITVILAACAFMQST